MKRIGMVAALLPAVLLAQHDMANMPGMAGMDHSHMNMEEANPTEDYSMGLASGTSMNPVSAGMQMLMKPAGAWKLMFMGQGYLVETQQTGPRGADKLYGPNWAMGSAAHGLWGGTFMLQTMVSLDPATVTNRSYPLLFQTGETAYGKPLVDAQHPHDLFMALGVHYVHALGAETLADVYYAPVGDPALGPVAFPHRASAAELPQAPLGHHWQDSTHIANNVVTVAMKYRWMRLEGSGFYGSEPNENRWNIDFGPMNSYAGRLSVFPGKNWMAQISAGRLTQPERPVLAGGRYELQGDVVRTTGSVHYSRPLEGRGEWSSSAIWGRNHNLQTRRNGDSYLAETVYPVSGKDFVSGRIEAVDKDELVSGNASYRVGAFTAGYTRDLGTFSHVETGVGANVTAYAIPATLQHYYGEHPAGVSVYLRFRLKSSE